MLQTSEALNICVAALEEARETLANLSKLLEEERIKQPAELLETYMSVADAIALGRHASAADRVLCPSAAREGSES